MNMAGMTAAMIESVQALMWVTAETAMTRMRRNWILLGGLVRVVACVWDVVERDFVAIPGRRVQA